MVDLPPDPGHESETALSIVNTNRRLARPLQPRSGGVTERIFCLALIFAATGCRNSGPPAPREITPIPEKVAQVTRPAPVIIYLIDTLRFDRVGAYGHAGGLTPNMDALARESVLFEQAYATAPWTLPSVVSIYTSTFPTEHGVTHMKFKLDPASRPLGVLLAERGYVNTSFVANAKAKYAVAPAWGYQAFNICKQIFDFNAVGAWIDQHRASRLHLYLHTTEPHLPFVAPLEFVQRYASITEERRAAVNEAFQNYVDNRWHGGKDKDGKPKDWQKDYAEIELAAMNRLAGLAYDVRTLYDLHVAWSDEHLGRTIADLRQRGLWDDCLFVLVSDHGEELGDHGGWLHCVSVYEELIRVPFMIKFPRGEYGGTRVPEPISLIDLAPTILDYLGAPDDAAGFRGKSLLPRLKAPATAPAATEPMALAIRNSTPKDDHLHNKRRGLTNLAVRAGTWKGIWNVEMNTFELYDLASDPGEQRNVSAEQPEVRERLEKFAHAWMRNEKKRAVAHVSGPLDAETLRNMKDLGYMGDEELDHEEPRR